MAAKKKSSSGGKAGNGVFDIHMLPAGHGDCLLITYGKGKDLSRVLIDCGTESTPPRLETALAPLKGKDKQFDLFVLTHIDADHIGGSINFFKSGHAGLHFDDVWFNGWKHLPKQRLGARQGEIFSTLIEDNELPWNAWFDGDAVQVPDEDLPRLELPGGMKLTLLSPTPKKLATLATSWEQELKKHGFTPGSTREYRKFLGGQSATMANVEKLADSKFGPDSSKPNGSSIAFLAEYGGKSALFVGDAHAPVLEDSIKKLLAERGGKRLSVDAFKLPHHGSRANLSKSLVQLLDCPHFLVSSNGDHFKHPDGEALARVVIHAGGRPTLHFNYLTKYNEFWGREDAQEKFGYEAVFPEEGDNGLVVRL